MKLATMLRTLFGIFIGILFCFYFLVLVLKYPHPLYNEGGV